MADVGCGEEALGADRAYAYAASLQTLTQFTPANAGQAGVYVPASNRPTMMPTWGSALPIGISGTQLTAIEETIPSPMRP
jgi:hypothetical protein